VIYYTRRRPIGQKPTRALRIQVADTTMPIEGYNRRMLRDNEAVRPAMTREERRKRPEHHVVHDYANLVSSGLLITDRKSNDELVKMAPVSSHVWDAFYMNCRKMYEFFHHQKSKDYLRAQQFVKPAVTFTFQHWTHDVQKFMNTSLLHVGGGRVTNKKVSTGTDDKSYLEEFQGMWEKMLRSLQDKHKGIFREEIEHRLDSEFRHCGTLGKECISK